MTSEDIPVASRERRWESGKRGQGAVSREIAESGAWIDWLRCSGTETGDARVGKKSCVETRRRER